MLINFLHHLAFQLTHSSDKPTLLSSQYYDAIFTIAKNVLIDAEPYMALKGHLQRVRHHSQDDVIALPVENKFKELAKSNSVEDNADFDEIKSSKVMEAIALAKKKISDADQAGKLACAFISKRRHWPKCSDAEVCQKAITLYKEAFHACSKILEMDTHAFQVDWFKLFW